MRKKGGMELSINAIVILIIAMVVLGIGILFIRNLFAKSGEKLTTAISSQEIKNPATPETPLVADREVNIQMSKPTKTIILSVFNPSVNTASGVNVSMSNCVAGISTLKNDASGYSFKTALQDIPANRYVGYQAIVTFNASQLSTDDTIVCKLMAFETGATKYWTTNATTTVQFTVTS
jgi:hypothetical protein